LAGVSNYSPSVSKSGSLCFSSPTRDVNNKGKSYYFKWTGDHYEEPKILSLNGVGNVRDPSISPDERYIIFISGHDIYISYRDGDGWTAGQKLGPQVNDGGANSSPCVSPDEKTLYYSSSNSKGILMIPINISKNIN
jgi:Tol biopolymer transport system component